MNSLLVSLPAAMIAVILCAVVLICAGVVGVVLGGRIAANKKQKPAKAAEKPARRHTEKPVKRVEEKPVQKVKAQPVKQAAPEIKEEPVQQIMPEVAKMPVAETQPEQPEEVEEAEAQSANEQQTVEDVQATTVETETVEAEAVETAQTAEVKAIETEQPEEPQKEEKPVASVTPAEKEKKFEVVKDSEGGAFVRIRYNRSFTAKLIQSDDTVKNYYSQVKNELKKYGVKERVSWKHETYRKGRKLIAKLAVRGKTLCLYCALDPSVYAGTKYKVQDVSAKKSNAEVPALFKIKNDRRVKYSVKIIEDLMQKHNLAAQEAVYTDYCAQYPYEELEPLIEKKLVKLLAIKEKSADSEVATLPITGMLPAEVLEEVSVAEAEEILPFENVEELIGESEKVSDRTKRGIVNVDELSKHFRSGERVTLDEMKRRISSIHKKTTYIKVLARGVLDKPLEVEADDFSPAAVKMIVLTGGKVTRTK